MGTEEGHSEHHKISPTLVAILVIIEAVVIGCFSGYGTYGQELRGNSTDTIDNVTVQQFYPFYSDVAAMIFVGFGFLMTFLKKYGFSAVGFNFLISAVVYQLGILIVTLFHMAFENHFGDIVLDVESLIAGAFASGSVMISFGAVLGRTSPEQVLVLAIFHLFGYGFNEALGLVHFQAIDMGGSMFVHSYGAYFGLAASFALTRMRNPAQKKELAEANERLNGSVYHSDLFAMIGTIILWIFWPSFNGALAVGDAQHRVVINTVLALCGSCVFAFLSSHILRGGKFDMVDVQNATLAGGVAVGSSADLVIGPGGAIGVGAIAGVVSVFGYIYITPFLEKKFGIKDTCGVHNLHGLPGLMGGLGGVISSSLAGESAYGQTIGDVFPARALVSEGGDGRSAHSQALYQLAALACTLAISIGSGLIGGFFAAKLADFPLVSFDDIVRWEVPEEEEDKESLISERKNGTANHSGEVIEMNTNNGISSSTVV